MVGIAVAITVPSMPVIKISTTDAVRIQVRCAAPAAIGLSARSSAPRAEAGSLKGALSSIGFNPRTKLDLRRPRAPLLAMHVKVSLGDRVGLEQAIGSALIGARIVAAANPAIDDEMRDVNVLRRQFARHALRKAAQSKLSHCEGRRARIALDAGRGAS